MSIRCPKCRNDMRGFFWDRKVTIWLRGEAELRGPTVIRSSNGSYGESVLGSPVEVHETEYTCRVCGANLNETVDAFLMESKM